MCIPMCKEGILSYLGEKTTVLVGWQFTVQVKIYKMPKKLSKRT